MFSSIHSASISGIDVVPITVEADVSSGLPQFTMVGYLSSQVREAQDRVKTSLRNQGIFLPPGRITINLSPADILKQGSRFDLPIALAILAAERLIPPASIKHVMAVGELSLNGDINPVTGILSIALKARDMGVRALIVPAANRLEAETVTGLTIIAPASLPEVIEFLRNGTLPVSNTPRTPSPALNQYPVDFSDIHGQESVKRAAMIAVSGFHNLLLIGPPGSGKTMLARRIPTILPDLTPEESLEITGIYSIAGLLPSDTPVIGTRPFRSPHHTITPTALTGGGRIPIPGEITLAHRGVLFLDEMTEFRRSSIESLRQPLEDREIIISRNSGSYRFPANFLLLAAMNPCPCGYYPGNKCNCSPGQITTYINRISKPLLDRIDICTDCSALSYESLTRKASEEVTSAEIRKQVARVHQIQNSRFNGTPIHFNSEIPSGEVADFCKLTPKAERRIKSAFIRYGLTARGYHKILKVARTIADLDSSDIIDDSHIAEAITYRTLTKKYWNR